MSYEQGYEAREGLNELEKGTELPQEGPVEAPEPVEPVEPAAKEADETLGYSSEYYKHRMENAIASGNKIAYENAKRSYAKAVVRESYGTGGGEAEESTEESEEALGYSSDYYKHQMSSALSSGNKIAYEHNKNAYSKALVRESLGSGTEEAGEIPEEGKEAEEALGCGHLQKEMKESIEAGKLGDKAASKRLFEAAQLHPKHTPELLQGEKSEEKGM